ncbi:MAG: STAS domain-containing protein [Desulfobacteraceae bacterium]|nr:STAS domain-containing protein [Desulfobacteraceae bacterium]
MQVQTEKSDGGVVMGLSGECTIEHALEIKKALSEALDAHENLLLQLGNVTAVDLSFLQLLCWAHRNSVMMSKHIRLDSGTSTAFQNTIEEAGFVRPLGCKREFHRSCLWAAE